MSYLLIENGLPSYCWVEDFLCCYWKRTSFTMRQLMSSVLHSWQNTRQCVHVCVCVLERGQKLCVHTCTSVTLHTVLELLGVRTELISMF